MKIQVNVQLDEQLYTLLAAEAREEDRTIAAQLRRIIKERYINQELSHDQEVPDTSES